MALISIQVNSDTIEAGQIEAFVGSENYEFIDTGHVKVFGKDAKEPQSIYYDSANNILEINTPLWVQRLIDNETVK